MTSVLQATKTTDVVVEIVPKITSPQVTQEANYNGRTFARTNKDVKVICTAYCLATAALVSGFIMWAVCKNPESTNCNQRINFAGEFLAFTGIGIFALTFFGGVYCMRRDQENSQQERKI